MEAVAALKRAIDVDRFGASEATADQVRDEWALPGLSLQDDVWVVEAGGSVVAYGLCWMEAPPDEVAAEQLVDPAHRGRGLNELLLGRCEARAASLLRAAAAGGGGTLGVWAHESDSSRLQLLERRGYRRERAFLRLERDLDDSLEAPVWPAGIAVAAFRPGVDDAAVHAAHEEAFADHYGPAEADLEEWMQSRFAHEGPDLGLWLVAWDGARGGRRHRGHGDAVRGLHGRAVRTPAVARPRHRQGAHARRVRRAERRGMRRAFFGVDAANSTGALHLHESIGFRSLRGATLLYEKRIARAD